MKCTKTELTPLCGEVYLVDFAGVGNTQRGLRPAVVFQNNTGNRYSPNVTVLPITSSLKKLSQDTHVLLPAKYTGLLRDSMVLCENPVCIPKSELREYITVLSPIYMGLIARASILASAAVAFLDLDQLDGILKRAVELNKSA
jgi:mRNA interferase MazF